MHRPRRIPNSLQTVGVWIVGGPLTEIAGFISLYTEYIPLASSLRLGSHLMERISSLFRQVSDSRTAKPEKFHLESAEASVHPTSIRIVESIRADDIRLRLGTHIGYCLFINYILQMATFNITQYYINNAMAHIQSARAESRHIKSHWPESVQRQVSQSSS